MEPRIPFNKHFIGGKELYYVAQAVTSGNIASDGWFTQQCCRILERRFEIHKVLMTPSCTAALEMAAMLCGLEPGDEVILPSFTFVSTANAVVRLGAKPVFIDVRRDTLNLDENQIEELVGPRTKAIIAVHYAGVACEMDRIMNIAQEHHLFVIEDAAQAVNAFYNGRALGSIGHFGTYSFHETKNYTSGEGGALCINVPGMGDRAEIIREKGTNRKQFVRGEVDKYTWVDVGSSYVPSEICCAFLYGQLEMLDAITEQRRKIYNNYRDQLQPLETEGLVQLPHISDKSNSNYHMFYILLPDMEIRDALMAYLREHGIDAAFHYVPLHSSPMGKNVGRQERNLSVTEELSGRLLRLPFYYEITTDDQVQVVNHITKFFKRFTRNPVQCTGARKNAAVTFEQMR